MHSPVGGETPRRKGSRKAAGNDPFNALSLWGETGRTMTMTSCSTFNALSLWGEKPMSCSVISMTFPIFQCILLVERETE